MCLGHSSHLDATVRPGSQPEGRASVRSGRYILHVVRPGIFGLFVNSSVMKQNVSGFCGFP